MRASLSASVLALVLLLPGCDPEAVGEDLLANAKSPPLPMVADAKRSKLGFQILRTTEPHDVHFEQFGGVLVVRGAEPVGLVVSVKVDSLVTENEDLTDHLKTAEFLDTQRYPDAKFTSRSITPQTEDDSTHLVEGQLTLRGVTRDVSFPGSIALEDQAIVARGELSIRPTDFAIQSEEMEIDMVIDEVALVIELHFPLPESSG